MVTKTLPQTILEQARMGLGEVSTPPMDRLAETLNPTSAGVAADGQHGCPQSGVPVHRFQSGQLCPVRRVQMLHAIHFKDGKHFR